MKEELIVKAYEVAKERYAAIGMDTDKAMDALQNPCIAGRLMM